MGAGIAPQCSRNRCLPRADGVGLQNVDTESCCAPMVLVDESAQNIAASDLRPGHRLRVRSRLGRLKLEAPMRPGQVVVVGVRA